MRFSTALAPLAIVPAVGAAPSVQDSGLRRIITAISGDNSTFADVLLPFFMVVPRSNVMLGDTNEAKRTICPDSECLLGYFPDADPASGDAADKKCIKAAQTRVLAGCPYNCQAEPTANDNPPCNGGWALYGHPSSGTQCLSCDPDCTNLDEPACT